MRHLIAVMFIIFAVTTLACGGPPTPAPGTSAPTAQPTEALTAEPMPEPTALSLPGLGETLEADGYMLAAITVENPAEPGLLYEPTEGTRLVAIEIIIGVAGGEPHAASLLNAALVDADGFAYSAELFGLDEQLAAVDLANGEKARGWIAFEMPESAIPASLKYRFEMFPDLTLQVGLE